MQTHIQHDLLPPLPLHDSWPSVIPRNGLAGKRALSVCCEGVERVSNINCAAGGDEGHESDEGPDHLERRAVFAENVCFSCKDKLCGFGFWYNGNQHAVKYSPRFTE